MGITAAQLTANISVTGADKAKADLIGVGETAESSGGVLKGALGGMALAASAALVGIGVQSVKMAGDFQSSITSLKTGAGESQSNLKKVSDGILSMATQTGTSSKQLSDGMYMIESAGFHGAAGLAVLKAAAEGAKVGGADLGVMAGGVTSLMHDYASSNYTATQATNALVTTVASGKTHMQDMANSLSAVLPLASSLHIPFEQVSGALATMTNAGVPAQRASQNLANTIRSLNVETSSGSGALDSIGLSAAKVHNALQNQGLPATLQMIEDHIGKKWPLASLDGQTALKAIMGGATGLNVALMIGGDHMKEYQGDVNAIGATLRSSSKDVQGWADVQGDFNQKVARGKEFVEALGIKLGTALLPIAGKAMDLLVQVGTNIEDAFSKVDWNKLFAPFKPIVTEIQTLVSHIDFKSLGNDAKTVGQIFLSLSPAGIQFQALASHAQELGKWFNTSVVPALKGAEPGFKNLGGALAGLLPAFKIISDVVHNSFQATFNALLPVFEKAIPIIIQIAGIVANMLGVAIKFLTPYIVQATQAIGQFATDIVQRVAPIVVQFFNNLQIGLNWLQKYWPQIWGTIAPYLLSVWDTITSIVKIAWALVSGIIKIGLDLLSGNWKRAWTDMGTMLGGIWSGIKDIIKGGINGMIGTLNLGIDALNAFIDAVENALNSVAKAVGLGSPIPVTSIPLIPAYSSGTDNHPGGAALVGEKGPEIALLPKGTAVMPAHMTSRILSGMPAYADGTGNILDNLMSWVSGGAQSILDNILKGVGLKLNLGEMSNMASGITKTVEKWAMDWINKTLMPKLPSGGGSAGPGQAVNVPGNVASWIMAAIGLTGVPSSWLSALETIAMHESGGNPNAVNNYDINAQEGHPSEGLMQTIGSTFAAHMVPGHGNILNPIDNAAAAINYIKAVYGSVFNVPGIKSMVAGGAYQGYADGTSFAAGGFSWVGERGKELMYVPRGAQITPHEQLNRATQQQQITVNPPGVYLDGRILVNGLMPYIADAIRYNVGTHNI